MNHCGIRFLSTIIASVDMEAGAIEMGKRRCKPEALRRRGSNETVELRDAIRIERIQSTSQCIIMEMLGIDSGGDEALGGFILKKLRDEVELLIHTTKPIKDHRFDGVAHGNHGGLWIVLYRSVKHVANTKFVKHPSHETEMVQDLTPGSSVYSCLLSMRRFYRHTMVVHSM